VSTGAFVIEVQRADGTRDRYAVSANDAAALRAEVSATMARVGRVVGEEGANSITEPARGAFVRNQMLLSALMYSPAVAALTHDATAGATLYLLGIGGSFFALTDLSRRTTITKAQNTLATDGALRATGLLFATYHAFGTRPSSDLGAATVLIGGIGGSIVGYQLGRGLTPGEAKAMSFGSTLAGLTALGVGGAVGLLADDGRGATALSVVGGISGYALGRSYPRRAAYSVTSGDIQMLGVSGLLGIMTAGLPMIHRDTPDLPATSALLTAGMLAGVWVGDRVFVRPFDHTDADANLVALGTVAGGLIGAAPPTLAQSENRTAYLLSITAGAALGTWGAEMLVSPRRAGANTRRVGSANRVQFDPAALALTALRRPGAYSVLRLSF